MPEEVRRLTRRDRGLVFPGLRGGMLGASAVSVALATADINATGHGFRSSFKDWTRHESVEELLSEVSLAHVEGSQTVAACARGDLLERRRPVMRRWYEAIADSDAWQTLDVRMSCVA